MSVDEHDPGFEPLLDFLKRSRGFDFSGYKRPSLERRFAGAWMRSAVAATATISTISRCTPRNTSSCSTRC